MDCPGSGIMQGRVSTTLHPRRASLHMKHAKGQKQGLGFVRRLAMPAHCPCCTCLH